MGLLQQIEHEKKVKKFVEAIEKLGCEEIWNGTIDADIIIKNDSGRIFK